ncbi:hypothetical protein GCM10010123_18060 [Pilimelia anulata]|uniref:Uncharacterized protein n=1 Tax=Pilimelia anulata TaxID=53371 RepID=A0A8J3F7H5_9ACTN|nr:hypothetical protein [Pilimelia anulata]GGJ88851.1 hypothetical protein GCM10010123_18060 [Pilimelia anulata]
MTIATIDQLRLVHACTGDAVVTENLVIHVTDGGPCQQPVTLRDGHTTTVIDCARRLPNDEQCRACRPIIVLRDTFTAVYDCDTLTGYHPGTLPDATADTTCRVCGDPLTAVLASAGRHLLCGTTQPGRVL